MTVIITRHFEDAGHALAAKRELIRRWRLSPRIIDLYHSADGLAEALTAAEVEEKTVKTYEALSAKGGAVMLVRSGYKPLGVAQITRDVTASMGASDLGDLVEEVSVSDVTPSRPVYSILQDHPHILTRALDSDAPNMHMADWPIPLLSKRVPFNDMIFDRHARMANWPASLISHRTPYTGSIFPRHARMADFPLPLLSDRKPFTGSIIGRHSRMAAFPLPLLSRRKPFTGSIFGRHQRMANWPFPHLLNGKTGTNALMPGGPRMANFPISLLSRRKPFIGSVFGRHARMANFPISLISKRKPFTGSVVPKHGRMANMFLPLVVNHGESGNGGFSLSKMLGMSTISRR